MSQPFKAAVVQAAPVLFDTPRTIEKLADLVHDAAHQRPADDVLGQARGLDQCLQVDAGFDAQLVAQEDHVLSADVARGVARLVAGEGASAQAGHGGIEQRDDHR